MLLRLVLSISMLFAFVGFVHAKRVALVIGNSEYSTFAKLDNPANDARLMEKALRDSGFEVTVVLNADQAKMKKAMLEFGRTLRKGVDASLFYYAGHGVQVNGENFLIPVEADLEHEDEVAAETIDVNDFLRTMQSAKSPFNIVVLDACRNNPLNSGRSAGGGGLAPVNAPKGSFIAYATSPGKIANDGEGERNSPYTSALAEALVIPGLKLEDVFKRTREVVLAATGEEQVPWETSSITGDFVFQNGPIAATKEQPIYSIAADFDFAKSLNSEAAWNLFLQRYGMTKDARVHVAIQERAKFIHSASKDDWADLGTQVFDFAIEGQGGLDLTVVGFSYNGAELFTAEAKLATSGVQKGNYVFVVVENGLNKRLAQWCVIDRGRKWRLLPKSRPQVALCDDNPFEIRGSYRFVPRTEKYFATAVVR